MASNNAAAAILVLVVAMTVVSSCYAQADNDNDDANQARQYVQSSMFAQSLQAQVHGDQAEVQGSSRHCFGSCTAGCINPFNSEPELHGLCEAKCKAQCQL